MYNPGGSAAENGHIGIVEKVFEDGSFQVFDSNHT
jgi:surface antigen